MKLIISTQKVSNASFHMDYEFVTFPINIGREDDNEIILEDARKIISRKHAKILFNDSKIKLVDLGSSNFTFLNGKRILPNDEYEINTDDIIKIGDYEMRVIFNKSYEVHTVDDQKTMIFSDPFCKEVSELTDAIVELYGKYLLDDSPFKSEMLRLSIMQNFEKLGVSDVNEILSEYFANKFPAQDRIIQSKIDSPANNMPQERIRQTKVKSQEGSSEFASNSSFNYSFSSHFSESIDIMLDTIIKLIQGLLQFKQEVFGVTIYHTIPTGSLKEIKAYLFDQEISTEEQRKRNNLIKDEIQKLLAHQLGLLEGYKISVTEGSQSLLQSLDPELIEKEIESKHTSILDNITPYSKKNRILKALKQNYKKYISDPYHLEKKFFRPAFIKGYQKRMSPKNENNEY